MKESPLAEMAATLRLAAKQIREIAVCVRAGTDQDADAVTLRLYSRVLSGYVCILGGDFAWLWPTAGEPIPYSPQTWADALGLISEAMERLVCEGGPRPEDRTTLQRLAQALLDTAVHLEHCRPCAVCQKRPCPTPTVCIEALAGDDMALARKERAASDQHFADSINAQIRAKEDPR